MKPEDKEVFNALVFAGYKNIHLNNLEKLIAEEFFKATLAHRDAQPAGAQEPVKAVLSENVLMIARVFKSGKMTPDSLEGWTSAVEVYESDFYTAPPAAAINEQLYNALKMVMDDPQSLEGRPRTFECVTEAIAAYEAAKKGGV